MDVGIITSGDRENRIITNQTNLTGHLQTGDVKHDLTSGVEFIYESQLNNTVASVSSARPQTNLYQPDSKVIYPAVLKNGQLTDGETMTSALYLHNTAHLSEQWQISTGLRAEHYNTDTHRVVAQAAVAKGQVQTIPVGTLLPQSASASDNLLSYKVGALYKPASNGSVYLSYATSQLPPGSNNFALTTSGAIGADAPNVDTAKRYRIWNWALSGSCWITKLRCRQPCLKVSMTMNLSQTPIVQCVLLVKNKCGVWNWVWSGKFCQSGN